MITLIKNLVLNLAVLATVLSCSGNSRQENYTVGIINLNSNLEPLISEFKKDMVLRGYNPGENITYLYNGVLKNKKQIEQEVLAMVDSDVDLFLTVTTPVTKKVKTMLEGSKLPILFAPVFSPVASGVVDSLASPGGNVTGIKVRGSSGKTLEWFLKAVPSVKRIFVPFHHTDKAATQTLEDLKKAADFFHIELVIENLSNEDELDRVLADIPDNIDGVWVTHSHLIISNIKKIVASAIALNKPVISSAGQCEKGVMLCYAPSLGKIGKQASRMADKILKGASPAAIPVETADYFLGLNLKTAHTIGIKIPNAVISQADNVLR